MKVFNILQRETKNFNFNFDWLLMLFSFFFFWNLLFSFALVYSFSLITQRPHFFHLTRSKNLSRRASLSLFCFWFCFICFSMNSMHTLKRDTLLNLLKHRLQRGSYSAWIFLTAALRNSRTQATYIKPLIQSKKVLSRINALDARKCKNNNQRTRTDKRFKKQDDLFFFMGKAN